MSSSESETESVTSHTSTGSNKRGKSFTAPRAPKKPRPPRTSSIVTRFGASVKIDDFSRPGPSMASVPTSMETDQQAVGSRSFELPGSSRQVVPRIHPILTNDSRTPRYTEIPALLDQPDSGFRTSPSYAPILFTNLIVPNPMYRGFILTHTSANFPKVMYQTGAYLAGAVLAIGFAKLRAPQNATSEEIKLRIVGEVTAMNVAPELLLEQAHADLLFLEILNFILHSEPNIFRGLLEYLSDDFITACNDPSNIDVYPIRGQFKIALPWPNEITLTSAVMTDATRICLWLTTKLSNLYKQCKAELSFSYLIAICRRGSVTSGFLDKVSTDITTELGTIVNFDEDLIRKIYRIYGIYINEFNAENVCNTILRWIPQEGLRLRLILQHTQGGGLTPHYTVKEALLKYPDFPWGRINSLLGGEIRSFIRAWSMIRGNQYYGFKRDLKEASSQSFKSLAYVAKELLIQAGGQGGLKAYKGWTRTPASKRILDETIELYMTNMGSDDAALDQATLTKLTFIANTTSDTPSADWNALLEPVI